MIRYSRLLVLTSVTSQRCCQIRTLWLSSALHKLWGAKPFNNNKQNNENSNTTHRNHTAESTESTTSCECKPKLHEMEENENAQLQKSRTVLTKDTYLEEHGVPVEEIADGVKVINLPPKVKEENEFEAYITSTSEYRMNTVSPHNTSSNNVDALGGGFGMLTDKRLGYLRPRQVSTKELSESENSNELSEAEEENRSSKTAGGTLTSPLLASIQLKDTFASKMNLINLFDQNGNPITFTDANGKPLKGIELRMERFRRQQEFIRSISGTTYSKHEHALLVDLDFAKDAHLYGSTREEFERNVRKVKRLISAYEKWEWTDNMYRYATILVQILVLVTVSEVVYNYSVLHFIANNYDDFIDVIEREVNEIEHVRSNDLQSVIRELKANPPDFTSVLDAMKREKWKRMKEEQKAQREHEREIRKQTHDAEDKDHTNNKIHTGDNNAKNNDNDDNDDDEIEKSVISSSGLSQLFTQERPPTMTVQDLVSDKHHHPMDTTHYEICKEKEEQSQLARELKRLRSSSISESDAHHNVWRGVKNVTQWCMHGVQSVMSTFSARLMVSNREQRRLYGEDVNFNDHVENEDSENEDEDERDRKMWSRLEISEEDKNRFSYVATPTGIATMRAIRRILLPESDDYTQIVREEMVAYQEQKKQRAGKLY